VPTLVLASVTSSVTSFIGDYGLYAVFVLMLVSAVFPAASELVMLYAGAVASGAFAGTDVTAFGHPIETPVWAYLAVTITGIVANLIGAAIGWAIGSLGGRPFLERHGRWLHVDSEKLDRTERRFHDRGALAVPLGFALPLARSFVAIPAGIVRVDLRRFVPLAFIGVAVFCFAVAGIGWAVGNSYSRVHGDLRYIDGAIALLAVVAVAAWLILRRRSSLAERQSEPS
jgi:membrane protein DedA with SNARE-associated domain